MSDADRMTPGQRLRFASGCAGKEQHVSRSAAEAVAALGRASLVPYRCEFGDHWHLATVGGHRGVADGAGRGLPFERLHQKRNRARHPRRDRRQ